MGEEEEMSGEQKESRDTGCERAVGTEFPGPDQNRTEQRTKWEPRKAGAGASTLINAFMRSSEAAALAGAALDDEDIDMAVTREVNLAQDETVYQLGTKFI